MKTSLLLLLPAIALSACGPTATADQQTAASPAASTVDQSVRDAVAKRGDKWLFEYSGDLEGSVGGGILAAAALGTTTTVTGGAMHSDRSGRANEAFTARIMQGGDTTQVHTTLTLADGTQCTDVYRGMSGSSSAQLLDASSKTFHATLEGTMKCGDAKDKTITFTALLKE